MRRGERCPCLIFTSAFFIRAASSLLDDLLLSLQRGNLIFGLGKWHEIKGCWKMLWAALGRTENNLEISVDCSFLCWRVANVYKTCFWVLRLPFLLFKEEQCPWAPSGILGLLWNKHEGLVLSSHLPHNKEPFWRPRLLVGWCWSSQPASLEGLMVCSVLSEVQTSGWVPFWCLCWRDGGPEMCKKMSLQPLPLSPRPPRPKLFPMSSWR